jgi:hypothetical protein
MLGILDANRLKHVLFADTDQSTFGSDGSSQD